MVNENVVLCNYGCGLEAKFKLKNGKECCSKSPNSCKINKEKNSIFGKKSYQETNRKRGFGDGSKEEADKWRKLANESRISNLKSLPFEQWGRALKEELILKEQEGKCLGCKIEKIWNNEPLVFELDHIDGNNQNELRENLRLLCPNCHSQTPTWRGRGSNKDRKKVTDEQILEGIKKSKNIAEVLKSVGLVAKGGNYNRVYTICKKYKIDSFIGSDQQKRIEELILERERIKKNKLESKIQAIEKRNKLEKNKDYIYKNRILPLNHQQGKLNSQYETCWIYNLDLKESKKIKKDELNNYLSLGWLKGRKIKFN